MTSPFLPWELEIACDACVYVCVRARPCVRCNAVQTLSGDLLLILKLSNISLCFFFLINKLKLFSFFSGRLTSAVGWSILRVMWSPEASDKAHGQVEEGSWAKSAYGLQRRTHRHTHARVLFSRKGACVASRGLKPSAFASVEEPRAVAHGETDGEQVEYDK